MFLETAAVSRHPFALTSTLFGYLYFRRKQGLISRIGAGSAAVASYLLRTIGVALLIAWILDAALRKEYRKASVRAAIAIVPIVLWLFYVHSAQSEEHYERPLRLSGRPIHVLQRELRNQRCFEITFRARTRLSDNTGSLNRFVHNLGMMSGSLGEAVSANEDPFWDGFLMKINRLIKPLTLPGWSAKCIVILLALTVIGGIGSMLWRRQWFIAIYLSVTIAGICTTPWSGQFVRYLVPAETISFACIFWLLDKSRAG